MTTFTCAINTPLGEMTAAAADAALTGLWFVGQKYYPAGRTDWRVMPDYPVFEELRRYLLGYFSGNGVGPDIPLKPVGSPFRIKVWAILTEIPKGEVLTYGRIAARLGEGQGKPAVSAQAVGNAVGHNPISILIPCHRVVGFDGRLTGYAGGLERKAELLRIEGVKLSDGPSGSHAALGAMMQR